MNPISVTYAASATGAQTAISVDWRDSPNGLAYEVSLDGAAVASVTIETTLDDLNSVLVSVTPIWTAIGSAITSDTRGVITGPIQFVRVNIGSLSGGTLTFKLLEGAPDGGGSSGGGGGGGDVVITDPVDAFDHVQAVLYDSAGNALTYNANGQATMANSAPVVIASNQSSIPVAGDVANDAADSGNPVKTGGIGIATLSGQTLVTAADRVNSAYGLDGAQLVRTQAALGDIVSGNASNTDGTSTQVIAAGAAGIKHYLMGVTLTNTSAAMIYVELKSGTTVMWTCPVPATGGYTYSWPLGLPPNAAAEAWNFDPSAATTTIYCSATAFKSKI